MFLLIRKSLTSLENSNVLEFLKKRKKILFNYWGCTCERLKIAFRYGVFVKIQIIGLNTGVK